LPWRPRTQDACAAAEQLVKDSGTSVGAIKRATHSYFSIAARDADRLGNDPPLQKVRVVTTIDFHPE